LFVAAPALAQVFVSDIRERKESPRSMYIEFKLSPFTPMLDSGFQKNTGPYFKFFGNQPMLLGEIEAEYEFFQKFGTISAGFSAGYAEKYGKALDSASGEHIGQSTGIHVVPIKVLIAYRFDWLKQKTKVPLVPYVKGAFVAMPWWALNGADVEQASGFYGSGARFGLSGVVGLALELDFLDQRLARDFDSSMGVNHTYLFAEATFQAMNIFPSVGPSFDWSSIHFMFGLALEL
jgi:hypothetical protein